MAEDTRLVGPLPTIKNMVEIRITFGKLVMGSQCDLHDDDDVIANTVKRIFWHMREQVGG